VSIKVRQGTVIDVQVFTREGIVRDKRAQQIIDDELKRFRLDLNDQLRIVEADAFDRIRKLLSGQNGQWRPATNCPKAARSTKPTWQASRNSIGSTFVQPTKTLASQLESIKNALAQTRHSFDLAFEEKRKKLTQGDELPAGRVEDGQGVFGGQASLAAW
jgi:DNA-directed RNA polymerase subunit beta